MSMTVAEKEALQAILKQKIDDRIEGLNDEAEGEFKEMDSDAELRACADLGIEDDYSEATVLYSRIQEDKRRLTRMWRALSLRLDLTDDRWNSHQPVLNEVGRVAGKIRKVMMADHPVGKQVLELEREKKEMMGSIWLATSTKQVKDLWKQLDVLLGNRMTQLEKEAMGIEPVEE